MYYKDLCLDPDSNKITKQTVKMIGEIQLQTVLHDIKEFFFLGVMLAL